MRTRRWQHFMSSSLAAAYAGALAICTMAPRNAHAVQLVQQSTEITGVVTDGRNRQPVSGASVLVVGTRLGVQSGVDGRFRIGGVSTGGQVVMVRRLGYATQRRSVTLTGPQVMNFELEPAAMSLDEVVVTGTAGGEIRRSIGNAVATINADDALAKSGAQSVSTLIGARAPGVIIAPSTGRLGAGPAIQIRGRSSIGLDNSPILFVDGVRVNNATNAGPVAPAGRLGGQASNVSGRLNDISPDDIESIEIIKGPAASTIYGTEAASGVIQIITKRGAAGNRPQTSLVVEEGSIFLQNAAGRVPTNYDKDAQGNIVAWNGVQSEQDRGTPLYHTGQTRKYNASLSGGREALTYFVSTGYENDFGVEPNNSLRQANFRGNLSVQPAPNVDFTTSLGYTSISSHLGADIGASALLGAVVGHKLLFPNARGFYPNYTPDVPQTLYDNAQGVRRFIGSATLTHRPTDWLSHRGGGGGRVDRTDAEAQHDRHDRILGECEGDSAIGADCDVIRRRTVLQDRTQRELPRRHRLSGLWCGDGELRVDAGSIDAGADAEHHDRRVRTGAVRLARPPVFDGCATRGQQLRIRRQVEMGDLSEGQSRVGGERRAVLAHEQRGDLTAVAWRIWAIGSPAGGVLRAAHVQPRAGSRRQLFNRLDVDFTYFNRRTTDLIINQPVAPSSGFYVATPANLGRVDNHGVEMLATLQALTRRNLSWDVIVNVATSQDQIKDLAGIGGIVVSAGQTNVVGYPIGGIFTKRVVSADRDATTGFATNVLCDGGEGKPAVACATAPFVFIGTPTPKVTGSVANTVTLFGNLRLYGLVDYKRGHRVSNNNEQLRCTGAVGAPLCRANYYPLEYDPVYLAERVGTAGGQGIVDQYFQDGSFAKLRERQ